ncbi:zinc ABC transporter substrate-binding protein [Hyphomicrobium sp.]|uniref:zinc ABC transporter substrate-binding protein n=1 Tax=Hyphomicrobium sp. TaxID=82 RepID=UPI0025C54E5E|nr:zinc ABC transporter substrate-binding protein [Hyphomicrobium sp.]
MAGGLWTLGQTLRDACAGAMRAVGLMRLLGLAITPVTAHAEVADVVVTIKPIHSLVARVMEGVGAPTLLVEGAASPHSFSLKPSQVRAINAAAVFIRVSERLEPFTAKIVRSLPAGVELVTLVDIPGLHLLSQRKNGTFEAHRHDHAAADHADKDDAVDDSHIWLDPDNAKVIGNYVAGVLGARYPQHAAQFRTNAERLSAEIGALTSELEATTGPLRNKPFVVFHDAYRYFDARFDLDAVGSITVSPDVQPSAKRLTELRQKIRSLEAVCVFAEPLFQPRLVAAVIEDTDARAGTLDPEGTGLEPGPQLYFVLMRNLAASLKSCLAPAS